MDLFGTHATGRFFGGVAQPHSKAADTKSAVSARIELKDFELNFIFGADFLYIEAAEDSVKGALSCQRYRARKFFGLYSAFA